ncbi:hypothetical protein [Bacillus sp. FJAT-45350]|uniref:hypothetical protein n=1 Tax=Bacillus sp. FJAT-45350 TaxID=2011014 RepID=UPI000BB7E4A9|nr:hypothetical protein [Bacillus sp. FJAT-45350]
MEDTLKLILQEIQKVNLRIGGLESQFGGQEKRMDGLESRFVGLEKQMDGFDSRFDSLERDIKELKVGQEQLQKNLVDSLGQNTEKIVEYVDSQTDALNKRLFTVETDIQKLMRQKAR